MHQLFALLLLTSCGIDPLRELVDRYHKPAPPPAPEQCAESFLPQCPPPAECAAEIANAARPSLEGKTYSAVIGKPNSYGGTLRLVFVDSKSTLRSRVQTDVLFNGSYRIVANCVEITEPQQETSYFVIGKDAITLTEVTTGLIYREQAICLAETTSALGD